MTGGAGEPAGREERLDAAVAEYLEAAESGREPARAPFLARFPDLAAELAEFLDDRERLHRLLGPLPPGFDTPTASCPRCRGSLETAADGATCGSCGWKPLPADPLPVPCPLGRFELIEVAGRGGFGTVYRGRDPRMGRGVAVKVLRTTALTTAEHRGRFLRDARIAAQLNHPGIVKVHDVGEADGVPYLVSEFIPGGTLADLIGRARPDARRAAALVAAVADTLRHAHEKGVIHRDVKPGNILLTADGAPMLTDFGLARWDAAEASLTEEGRILGTLHYMSPEQARGHAHRVDARSDVYGLGVVLYELLTGERPFAGNVRGVLHQIEFDEPRAPRTLDDRVPADLETICLKCLRKEPGRRYASAAELAADLRRFLAGQAILARPVGRRERLSLWARRNPALAAAVVLAMALLTATAAVSAAWAVHAGRQADAIRKALRESQRSRAEVEFERGLAEAERGEYAAGLLWLAQSLETLPAGEGAFGWTVRANIGTLANRSVSLSDSRPLPPGNLLGVSPDGAVGWALDPDGRTVRRWDLDVGRPAGVVLNHPSAVTALALAPDAARAATVCPEADRGSVVRVWEAGTGTLVRTFATGGTLGAVAFFRDGQKLLTAAQVKPDPGQPRSATRFQVWEAATGSPTDAGFTQPDWVTAMAVAPDGKTLYTVTRAGKTVHRVPVGGGAGEVVISSPVAITALAVGPDQRYLLTGGSDRATRLHEFGSNRSFVVGRSRKSSPVVAADPDGRQVTTAGPGDAARTWEGLDRLSPPPERHSGPVRAVAVSSDGQRVATGDDGRQVRIWEFRNGRLGFLGALPEHRSPVAAVAFTPDGDRLATSTHQHNEASLWDAATLARGPVLRHPDRVRSVAFSPDGTRAATVGFDRAVRVWKTDSGELSVGPLGQGAVGFAVVFSPDGRTLLTGSIDGAVRRWDADTGEARGDPLWHSAGEPVYAVAYSTDGRFILSGGEDGTARLWGDGGQQHGPPLRHTAPVRSVAFGPSGRWVVTGGDDGTARYWSADTGREIGPALRHDGAVRCAAIDPFERWVVTGGQDQTVRVWPAPATVTGPPHRVTLWAQVRTGAELAENGELRVLDTGTWRRRRDRLRELDGVQP